MVEYEHNTWQNRKRKMVQQIASRSMHTADAKELRSREQCAQDAGLTKDAPPDKCW